MSRSKYEFLYDYASTEVERELARFDSFETKAGRLGTLLTVVIVAFSTLLRFTSSIFFPAAAFIDWIICILAGLAYLALFSAWLRVLGSLKIVNVPRMPFTQEVMDLVESETLSTSKKALAKTSKLVIAEMRDVLSNKSAAIRIAYQDAIGAGWLLTVTLFTIVIRAAFVPIVGS
jgi:hypothetical protein